MKIKNLSFLLALVMILSAFAGTFTVSAEGEDAVVNAWELNGTGYAAFQDAIDAAVPGDTIYLVADYVQTGDIKIYQKDITVEGRQKANGTNPVFTHQPAWDIITIGAKNDPEGACSVTFKNFDFVTRNIKQNSSICVCEGCEVIFDNVKISHEVGAAAHYLAMGFVRIYNSNNTVTFKECDITVPEGAAGANSPAIVGIDYATAIDNTVTFDTCNVDLTPAATPHYPFQAANSENTVIVRNSTINTPEGVDYPIALGTVVANGSNKCWGNDLQVEYTGTVDYRGTNVINGVTTQNADVDYLIYDNKAKEEGYTIRVGAVKDAIILKEDGSVEFIGYYKDLVEACNAAAATETEKQKEVFLIDNVTVTSNLTIPTATIDGQNKTLTAPRIYKAQDAILNVANLYIVTNTEAPILQMNADSVVEGAENAPAPSYAKFTKCTFTTTQKVPYAYFVLQADLTLDRCKINITNAECDKPIFRMDKGADVTLAGCEINVADTAPNLIGFDVVNEGGTVITLKGNTEFTLGQSVFTAGSKANVTFVVNERASLSAEADAIVIGEAQTGWIFTISGTATITSAKGTAISIAAPDMEVTIGGNAKVSGGNYALRALAAGVTFKVDKDATVEMPQHAKNKSTVSLEGEGSKLISEGTITALSTKTSVSAINASGANSSVLIKNGAVNGYVLIGTEQNAAVIVVTGGALTADEKYDSVILVTKGSAEILSGTISGAKKAIAGAKEVAYAEGETSVELKELYTNMPVTVGASMRMNDGSLGMRFTSTAAAEVAAYAESLKACGAVLDYEFGTLIVRETEIRGKDMTVEALAAENVVHAAVKADAGIVKAEDGSITYTAAVINFTEDNMGTSLTARAYIKYTLIDGSALYVYATDRTEGISLGELAQMALADVSFESAEGYRNRVESFYEADEDGWYELIEEVAYSPYSKEQQAALAAFVENADL